MQSRVAPSSTSTRAPLLTPGTDVKFVKGVGPRIAEKLAEKGVHTVEDLLYYLPFRYEDRANPKQIQELKAGEMASVIGEMRGAARLRTSSIPIFGRNHRSGSGSVECSHIK